MPVITLYQSGTKMGCAPGLNDHPRALRGDVDGWSPGATRRNTDFLKSVDVSKLDGDGFALTLSVGESIPDPLEFRAAREAFFARLRRAGMIRLHWVIEWQKRGAPHLHIAVYFPRSATTPFRMRDLLDWWLDCGGYSTGALLVGQDVKPIDGALGWLQYLAKHASRGAAMYQRSSAGVPASWRGHTGRLWGKARSWPVGAVVRLEVEAGGGDKGYYALRRMVRCWRLADSRCDPVVKNRPRRIRLARQMLKCSNRHLSAVKGPSEWLRMDPMLQLIGNLVDRGYSVGHYLKASELQERPVE